MSKILLSTQLKGQGRQSGKNMTKTGYLPEKAKHDKKWRSPENRKDQPGTQTQNTGKERKREIVSTVSSHSVTECTISSASGRHSEKRSGM